MALSKFVWKKDNLEEEWLDHGRFSLGDTTYLTDSYLKVMQAEEFDNDDWLDVNFFEFCAGHRQYGIPSTLKQDGKHLPLLEIDLGFFRDANLVFDQNYKLLGKLRISPAI